MPYKDKAKQSVANKKYRDRLRKDGLCINGCGSPAVLGKLRCKPCVAKIIEWRKTWRLTNKGEALAQGLYNRLKYRHGLTIEEKRKLLDSQNGKCANIACGVELDLTAACIDHDHKCLAHSIVQSCSKCQRGLLCSTCNLTLGHFNDDSNKIRGLADYIEKSTKLRNVGS